MIVASRAGLVARAAFAVTARCGIATSSLHRAKPMPPRPPPINEEEFTETFLKGTGPGGQKIVCSPNRYSIYIDVTTSSGSTIP